MSRKYKKSFVSSQKQHTINVKKAITYQELAIQVRRQLATRYPENEARWMTRIVFEEIKGYDPVGMALHADSPVSDFIAGKISAVVSRLLKDEPIQYIFGNTTFHGMKFRVTPDTLIPRQETDELVDMIIDENRNRTDLDVIDLGTGSGCIAISLARNLPFSRVTAIDISTAALNVAKDNAKTLHVSNVTFSQADIFRLPSDDRDRYDIIVSNPPYVLDGERCKLEKNVLAYEPSLALFVPDTDPLKFYHAIADYASHALKAGGRLYFEINPLTADPLADDMRAQQWHDVTVSFDISRRKRFLSASKL